MYISIQQRLIMKNLWKIDEYGDFEPNCMLNIVKVYFKKWKFAVVTIPWNLLFWNFPYCGIVIATSRKSAKMDFNQQNDLKWQLVHLSHSNDKCRKFQADSNLMVALSHREDTFPGFLWRYFCTFVRFWGLTEKMPFLYRYFEVLVQKLNC